VTSSTNIKGGLVTDPSTPKPTHMHTLMSKNIQDHHTFSTATDA